MTLLTPEEVAKAVGPFSLTVQAWKSWVSGSDGWKKQIIVQVINRLHLSKKWERYEKAVENFNDLGVRPEQAEEVIRKAGNIAWLCNYDYIQIRQYLEDPGALLDNPLFRFYPGY